MQQKLIKLINKYKIEKKFDSILCETFALTREASKRSLGQRLTDSQLNGGIQLHYETILKRKNPNDKTFVSTLSIVFIVTVNAYLAKRDKEAMEPILGLSVALIQENRSSYERLKNYTANITYVTNSEIGFDYLRGNLRTSKNDIIFP